MIHRSFLIIGILVVGAATASASCGRLTWWIVTSYATELSAGRLTPA